MDEENRCHIQRVEPPPWIGPPTSEKLNPKLKSPEEEAVRVWTRMCALVKTELDERRHTVTWLGQQAGISHSSVLRAVGQKRPDPPEKFLTVIRCAHALGMRFTIDGEVVE